MKWSAVSLKLSLDYTTFNPITLTYQKASVPVCDLIVVALVGWKVKQAALSGSRLYDSHLPQRNVNASPHFCIQMTSIINNLTAYNSHHRPSSQVPTLEGTPAAVNNSSQNGAVFKSTKTKSIVARSDRTLLGIPYALATAFDIQLDTWATVQRPLPSLCEHQGQRCFHPGIPEGVLGYSWAFSSKVWVIGGDKVNHAIEQSLPENFVIMGRSQGRIHLRQRADLS